jgi:hypothetical protein
VFDFVESKFSSLVRQMFWTWTVGFMPTGVITPKWGMGDLCWRRWAIEQTNDRANRRFRRTKASSVTIHGIIFPERPKQVVCSFWTTPRPFSPVMLLCPSTFQYLGASQWDTPSVPNYLSVLIGTQILRNLWGICKNAQLGLNPDLNQLSNELFCT